MEHRKDRLETMLAVWPEACIQSGIIASMPHTGCALAHIQAIKKGLAQNNVCLVLEDDAELLVPKEEFLRIVHDIAQDHEHFDACVICPNHDDIVTNQPNFKVYKKSRNCFQTPPTNYLISTHCVLYTSKALPLFEEYEKRLLAEYIFLPIDRFLFTNEWDPHNASTWEPCIFEKNFKMPQLVTWTQPNTWFYVNDIVRQNSQSISDHTKQINFMFNRSGLIEYCNTNFEK